MPVAQPYVDMSLDCDIEAKTDKVTDSGREGAKKTDLSTAPQWRPAGISEPGLTASAPANIILASGGQCPVGFPGTEPL